MVSPVTQPPILRATRPWLRAEGAAVLLVSLLLYGASDASWWLFALLLLVPDVSMVGYLAGPRVGAVTYNVVHTYVAPLLLAAVTLVLGADVLWPYVIIWTAHIGMDRMLGYGLKLPEGFKHAHLGRLDAGQRE